MWAECFADAVSRCVLFEVRTLSTQQHKSSLQMQMVPWGRSSSVSSSREAMISARLCLYRAVRSWESHFPSLHHHLTMNKLRTRSVSSCPPIKPSPWKAGTAQAALWKRSSGIKLEKSHIKVKLVSFLMGFLGPWIYNFLTITLQHSMQCCPDFFLILKEFNFFF